MTEASRRLNEIAEQLSSFARATIQSPKACPIIANSVAAWF